MVRRILRVLFLRFEESRVGKFSGLARELIGSRLRNFWSRLGSQGSHLRNFRSLVKGIFKFSFKEVRGLV